MSLRQHTTARDRARALTDRAMRGCVVAATGLAIVPLVLIIAYVTVIGGRSLSWEFFTDVYRPPAMADVGLGLGGVAPAEGAAPADPFANVDLGALTGATSPDPALPADLPAGQAGEGGAQVSGGVLHAIVGTLLVTAAALLLSVPVGVLAGVFLAEYPANTIATAVRFCCDVLSGAPSIVVGVTAYVLVVNAKGPDGQPLGFSGWAGAVALTFLMVPTITRTTEEMLKLVPEAAREAALALGAPAWYSTFTVVIPTALSGIVTGVMLAFARGAGETAPLIMTVLGSNVLVTSLAEPIAALPLIAYRYTESPFPAENDLAWGSAFVLMTLVLLVNVLVRVATRGRQRGR